MTQQFDIASACSVGNGNASRSETTIAATDDIPALIITGHRQNGRHIAYVCGEKVRLSTRLFDELLDLVVARYTNETGYRCVPRTQVDCEYVRLQIHRLRKAIDSHLHPGFGRRLVESGIGTEYRLTPTRGEIAIDPTFGELPPHVIDASVFAFLKRQIVQHPVDETESQSDCNGDLTHDS